MRTMLAIGAVALLWTGVAGAQEEDPLAALAALGSAVSDAGPEGGGSIRAKKEADTSRPQRLNDKRNVEAKVEEVSVKGFPIVALKLRVAKAAADGAGKAMKANDKIVVVPMLKVAGKQVDMGDEATRINAGAFYLQSGDKVMVRLGAQKGKYWEVEYIERK